MDFTIFLAQLWGPVLLATGVGILFSSKYYLKIYRDMEKQALAVLVFGMIAMAAGIAHILVHSNWNSLPEIVVSALGWGLLLKGTLFVAAPGFVDKSGDWWVRKELIPVAGILTLIVGAYLGWVGYLAG